MFYIIDNTIYCTGSKKLLDHNVEMDIAAAAFRVMKDEGLMWSNTDDVHRIEGHLKEWAKSNDVDIWAVKNYVMNMRVDDTDFCIFCGDDTPYEKWEPHSPGGWPACPNCGGV